VRSQTYKTHTHTHTFRGEKNFFSEGKFFFSLHDFASIGGLLMILCYLWPQKWPMAMNTHE
jgi:hypothetical protein